MAQRIFSARVVIACSAAGIAAAHALADVIPVAGYTLLSSPSASYGDSGNELTDGTWAGGINPVGPWVGWEGNSAIVAFDLGARCSITSIDIVACNWTAAGVYLPTLVRFEFSDTADFTGAPLLEFSTPFAGSPPESAALHTFLTDTAPAARYVRLTVEHDHQWLFLGEVTFNGLVPAPGGACALVFAALASRRRR